VGRGVQPPFGPAGSEPSLHKPANASKLLDLAEDRLDGLGPRRVSFPGTGLGEALEHHLFCAGFRGRRRKRDLEEPTELPAMPLQIANVSRRNSEHLCGLGARHVAFRVGGHDLVAPRRAPLREGKLRGEAPLPPFVDRTRPGPRRELLVEIVALGRGDEQLDAELEAGVVLAEITGVGDDRADRLFGSGGLQVALGLSDQGLELTDVVVVLGDVGGDDDVVLCDRGLGVVALDVAARDPECATLGIGEVDLLVAFSLALIGMLEAPAPGLLALLFERLVLGALGLVVGELLGPFRLDLLLGSSQRLVPPLGNGEVLG
jgi:hypothetical protein